jgi:hypothetical protein
LFYVAMTRAKSAVELPPGAMLFFGITNSRSEHFGTPYVPESRPASFRASVPAGVLSQTPRTTPAANRPLTTGSQSPGDSVVSKILRALLGK